MIAPLATLVFLVTMWLLVVVGAAVLEESGAKIAAALKGELSRPQRVIVSARTRARSGRRSVRRSPVRWRAAA